MTIEEIIEKSKKAVMEGDASSATEMAKQAVAEGVNPVEVINKGLTSGMTEVGEAFAEEEVSLPEVLLASEAMKQALEILEPHIPEGDEAAKLGKVIIGTVQGDVHDIGKRIVCTMLGVHGFEVIDLGRDVPIGRFVEKAKELEPDIIGTSALMTTTMPGQQKLEEELEEAGIRDKVKTMIGGAAVSQSYADKIGADVYGEDANDAVAKAKELVG